MAIDPDSKPSARQDVNAQLMARALATPGRPAIHRPAHVYLQVASACNLDCYMCSEHNRPEGERNGRGLKSMAPEIFARIESDVFPWSSRTVFGVGGEPTIAPHFADYLRRAARAGQEIHLVTNGTRFEQGEVAELVARHVSQLFVSLDAATPATYERIRRGSRWDRVMRGLERLRELRAQAPGGGGQLTLSFVLMRSNVAELPAFVELARDLGATRVHAQHVIPVNAEGQVETLFDEPELYDRVIAVARRRADELGIVLEAPHPYAHRAATESPEAATTRGTTTATAVAAATTVTRVPVAPPNGSCGTPLTGRPVPCSLPVTSVFVLYDGRVYPCCHPFAHSKMQIGDLRTQSVAEIWNGKLYRSLRAGLPVGDVPETCRNCSCVHDPPPAAEDPVQIQASLDLAAYYGGRDLAPNDPGGVEGVHAELERKGWTAYVEDLRRHASTLELERDALRTGQSQAIAHATDLVADRARGTIASAAHARTIEAERDALIGHVANLEGERPHLVGHIANLERELSDLRRHAGAQELECDALRTGQSQAIAHATDLVADRARGAIASAAHARTIEAELDALLGHVANLESERPHLVGHIANLERELSDLRSRWTLRQRLVLRLRRLVARIAPRSRFADDGSSTRAPAAPGNGT